jgi:hypothetical protein
MAERHIRPAGRKLRSSRLFRSATIVLAPPAGLVNVVLLIVEVETFGSPWWLVWEWLVGLMLLVVVRQTLLGGVVVRDDGSSSTTGWGACSRSPRPGRHDHRSGAPRSN